MDLRKEFKKETGEPAMMGGPDKWPINIDYIEWLEKRCNRLQSWIDSIKVIMSAGEKHLEVKK